MSVAGASYLGCKRLGAPQNRGSDDRCHPLKRAAACVAQITNGSMDWCCHWDLPSTALASPNPLQADPATLLYTPAAPHLTNAHPVNEVRAGLTPPFRSASKALTIDNGSSRYKGPDTAGSDKFRPDRATIIPPAARLPFR